MQRADALSCTHPWRRQYPVPGRATPTRPQKVAATEKSVDGELPARACWERAARPANSRTLSWWAAARAGRNRRRASAVRHRGPCGGRAPATPRSARRVQRPRSGRWRRPPDVRSPRQQAHGQRYHRGGRTGQAGDVCAVLQGFAGVLTSGSGMVDCGVLAVIQRHSSSKFIVCQPYSQGTSLWPTPLASAAKSAQCHEPPVCTPRPGSQTNPRPVSALAGLGMPVT